MAADRHIRLQAGSAALFGSDPRFNLHDGRFERVEVDRVARTVTMVVNCGDLHVGYRRLTLAFRGAEIVSRDVRAVAEAIGAEFRGNHWHEERAVTEIAGQSVESRPDGRHQLRLDLDPFGRIAVAFETFEFEAVRTPARAPARPGRFVILTEGESAR